MFGPAKLVPEGHDVECVVCYVKDHAFRMGKDLPVTTVEGLPVHRACAHDLEYAVKAFEGSYYDGDVLRWDTNASCPFDDMTAWWVALGYITPAQHEATRAQRDVETQRFLEEYRRNDRPPSAEELFEMRAAFGEGKEVVNVITGRVTRL